MDNDTQLLIVDNNANSHHNDDDELILTKPADQLSPLRESSRYGRTDSSSPSTSADINLQINHHSDPYLEEHHNRREYDDFTTIDWVRDRTRYLKRHRSLKVNQKKGWWNWLVSSYDAWSGGC